MILISDSGSTKTTSIAVNQEIITEEFISDGTNPYVHSQEEIDQSVFNLLQHFTKYKLKRICFYGAGSSEPDKAGMIYKAFATNGIEADMLEVNHDLIAAARSLFGTRPGIACILGTGSSSCAYRNGLIKQKVMALGYMIGDEGGGVDIGRRLLKGMLKGTAPKTLRDEFFSAFKLKPQELLDRIYFRPSPNRYIASFTPFVREHLNHEYCVSLVQASFEEFILQNILQYDDHRVSEIGFVGSVAWNFRELLIDTLNEFELKSGSIIQNPMQGLIDYHRNKLSE